jgi:predicted Fe-S protein YdhL (DUF1289 family)
VQRCTLDAARHSCVECRRTIDEIVAWRTLDAAAQWAVVRALPARRLGLLLTLLTMACAPRTVGKPAAPVAPAVALAVPPTALLGAFQDDYGSRYEVTAARFVHGRSSEYLITEWNVAERYFLAQNAPTNPADGGRWTRVDWVEFTDQGPFRWGYCFSAFRERTQAAARAVPSADRSAPRSGCHGFPFSRMQRVGPP